MLPEIVTLFQQKRWYHKPLSYIHLLFVLSKAIALSILILLQWAGPFVTFDLLAASGGYSMAGEPLSPLSCFMLNSATSTVVQVLPLPKTVRDELEEVASAFQNPLTDGQVSRGARLLVAGLISAWASVTTYLEGRDKWEGRWWEDFTTALLYIVLGWTYVFSASAYTLNFRDLAQTIQLLLICTFTVLSLSWLRCLIILRPLSLLTFRLPPHTRWARWRPALHGASGEDQVVAAGDSELEEAQPVDELESEPESEAREGDDGDGEERVEGDEEEEDRRREQPNALLVALLSSPLLAQTEEGFVDDNKQCTLQSELIVDHNNVKDLYHRYKQAKSTEEKSTLVNTIIRELAQHSEAEEVSVYNVLEEKGLVKDSKELRDEHKQLEKVLYSVDWTKVDSAEFEPKFDHAIQLFIKHSDREEEDVLKQLDSKLTAEENDKLAKDFLAKRDDVAANMDLKAPDFLDRAVRRVFGMGSRPRDELLKTLQGHKFTDLRYQHGQGRVEAMKFGQSLIARDS